MKQKRTKSIKLAIACTLILTITVITGSQLFAQAAGYMTGIESLVIKKNDDNKSYTILEIVPTHDDGQLGYLVAGQEPVLLTDRLEEWIQDTTSEEHPNTKENRAAYIRETLERLQKKGICGTAEAVTTPITYTTYQEKYFLSKSEDATAWEKVNFSIDNLEKTQVEGYYEAADNGEYSKNITSFEYVGEKAEESDYVVIFVPLTNSTSEEEKALGIYRATDGSDAGYQLATEEEIEEGAVSLFYISEYEYLPEEESSAYKAVLDSERPYTYVETDGDCDFVPADGETAVYVEVGAIYYQGGFTNQEWFKNHVLKTANSDEQQLQVQVLEKTVEEVQKMDTNDFLAVDFVHISGTNVTDYPQNTSSLKWEKVVQLFTQIAGERKIPCMVNSNLMEGLDEAKIKNSSFNKLLALSMQSNLDSIYEQIKNNETKEPDWASLVSSIKNDNGYEWIQKNVYSYRADLIKNWTKSFTNEQIKSGYEEIRLFIEKENLYRGSKDKLEETITPAVCMQYTINFAHTKEIKSKTKIKVLELQPCKSYSLTKKMVLEWNGASTTLTEDQITIDQMTSSEFIGKINDLNTEYDLIYMGLNTGAMNTDDKGNTVYNDESMNGLVYMHTGDAVISSAQLAGLMDHDYVQSDRSKYINPETYNGQYIYALRTIFKNGSITSFKAATQFASYVDAKTKTTFPTKFTSNVGVYRYSGNDITKEKMEELLEYVSANYPVVLADSFYKDSNYSTINTSKIDNSSYLYDFLEETKACNNVLPVSKIQNSSLFSYYINMPKLGIDFMTSTGAVISEESNNYNESVLTTTKENGRYYVNLYFSINNEMNTSAYTKYIPAFYIDLNADGKFSSKTELFSANDAKVMDENGKIVSTRDEEGNYLLQSGKKYHLKKELPSSYQSIMTWKLEVQQSNSYIRTSKVCYTPIKGVGTESETVKVLQIRVDKKYDGGSLANTWDLAQDESFKKLLKDKETSTGLTFVLNSQQASDYTNAYHEAKNQGKNYLDDYDMLIIGFADAYAEISDADAVQGILDFIKSGKSILFTHDTTSFVNVEKSIYRKQSTALGDYTTTQLWNGNYYWGYNINKYLREIVGMDRYGIMDETSSDGVNDILQKGEIIDLTNKATLSGLNSEKDKAYAAGSSKTYAYGETQGYTNHLLDQQRLEEKFTKYWHLKNESLSYKSITNRDVSVQVTQVNEGQITTYPYEIPETFKASSTHYQYFQLDLERDADNDGESDIVVWYCLGQRAGANPYAQSPNDVRNAYYIYSIGNVMYSGVGHSTVTAQDSNDWERKLFVNTIVAAYKTGVKSPTVSILEDKYVTAQEKEYEYLTFDESILAESGGAIDKEITFYYSIADSNLVTSDKTISAEYYIGDSQTPITATTYTAAGKAVSSNALESGEVYSVTIPVEELTPYLKGKDSVAIRIEAKSEFNYYGKETSLTANNQLTVVKTILQELN